MSDQTAIRPDARIGLIYPKAIGDLVFLLPALHTLRANMPEARLLLIAKEKQAPLAANLAGRVVDKVFATGRRSGFVEAARELRRFGADVCVDLAGNDQAGLVLALAPGRKLRPHRADCRGACALYTPFADAVPRLPSGLHRVDELLAIVRCLCPQAVPAYSFRLYLQDSAVEESERMTARHALRFGKVIALNVGASRACKRWPARHFRSLAEALVENGYRVVIMGSSEFKYDGNYDRTAVLECFSDSFVDGERCVDLVRNDRLSPTLQLQRDSHFLRYSGIPLVVVGNDTGPMQIAGSVGDDARIRTVSLFGPTSWRRYAPYDPERIRSGLPAGGFNLVLAAGDVPCMPRDGMEACRRYRRHCATAACMTALRPEVVLEAVMRQADAAVGE